MQEAIVLITVVRSIEALLLTLLLEAPIIWISMMRKTEGAERNKLIANFIIINAITNIPLNMIVMALVVLILGGPLALGITIILELIVPFIEAKMYYYTTKRFSLKRLLVTCYVANAVSFIVGSALLMWLR